MPITDFNSFFKKNKDSVRQVVEALGGSAKKEVRSWMLLANDKVNGKYPFAHYMMKRSIQGKGAVKFAHDSAFSKQILYSSEFKALLLKQKGSVCLGSTLIKFRSSVDLGRAIHNASFAGNIEVIEPGKKYKIDGTVSDTYDFRFDLIPDNMTIRGAGLRTAGNIAYICQQLKLMSNFKVTLEIKYEGKI